MQRTTGNSYKKKLLCWLTDINTVAGLAHPGRPHDLFAFKINYNQVEDNASNGVVPLYNGNISETYWRSYNDNVLRNYGYTYDALNRLEEAFYQKPGYTQPNVNNYREKLTYDLNGNITHLWRNGELDATNLALEIDDLTYTYAPDSNLLLKVTDATASPAGFQDDATDGTLASDATDDYLYDAMGNMIKDENKNIRSITYNHLNLPTFIDFGWRGTITYLYDATGRKVRKVVQNNVLSQNIVTDYANGFQYLDHVIQHFPTAEGYVSRLNLRQENGVVALLPSTELPVDFFTYVYNYTDHLGNIRLSYAQDPDTQQLKIVEQNHYYPFGLRHTNYSGGKMQVVKEQEFKRMAPTPEELLSYKYKYNGKEYQDELGLNLYDYGARNYDPALGRWMNIDPKAETSRRWNPYTYCYNSPLRFVDPDGMEAYNPGDKFKTRREAALDFAKQYNGISIINNVELHSNLYKVTSNGETYYSYTVPTGQITLDEKGNNISGQMEGVDTTNVPEGSTLVGRAHTHSFYRQDGENEFSEGDKITNRSLAEKFKDFAGYVATPKGELLEHDPYVAKTDAKPAPGTQPINTIANDVPSDPDAPQHNNVSPNVTPNVMPIINGETNYELKTKHKSRK